MRSFCRAAKHYERNCLASVINRSSVLRVLEMHSTTFRFGVVVSTGLSENEPTTLTTAANSKFAPKMVSGRSGRTQFKIVENPIWRMEKLLKLQFHAWNVRRWISQACIRIWMDIFVRCQMTKNCFARFSCSRSHLIRLKRENCSNQLPSNLNIYMDTIDAYVVCGFWSLRDVNNGRNKIQNG